MSDTAVPYPKRALQSTFDKLKLYNKDIYPNVKTNVPVGRINNLNTPGYFNSVSDHREKKELFALLNGQGATDFKPAGNWCYQPWYRNPPYTDAEAISYLDDIQRFMADIRQNRIVADGTNKVLLGKLLPQRQQELQDLRNAIRGGFLGTRYDPEVYPADFYQYDISFRTGITTTFKNFHLEKWFNFNPVDYKEWEAFYKAINSMNTELSSNLSGTELSTQQALLNKRKLELHAIKNAMIWDARLYSPTRWPKLGRFNYIPEGEVEIYTPKDRVDLVGKDLTIQSFADAYNTLVADKLNSLFKQSADFLFNDAAPNVKPSAWEIPAYKEVIDKIKLHLDNPVDGDFGIMQASNAIIPEALKNTVNPDEVKSQYYIDNNEPSIKNVMKALDNSITMLSRIRKFSVRIIYQPPGGATQDLGLFEVYRLLTLDWAFPDLYKEFYRVGEDITEANVTKLFNDIYKELIKIINGEREIPNPKPEVNYQGLNNLTLYFAPGRMLSSDEIVRGK